MTDEAFADRVAARLAMLPAVAAVALGGSRAAGTERPDSDWDFAVYYRGGFDPQTLRDVGWAGEISDIGAWGGGVFNGGAWLHIDGRRVDVHYRNLDSVEHELAEAAEGQFRIEPLLFHLAGIPSYLVVAELATCRTLRGRLPTLTAYPAALRANAPKVWWSNAELVFDYARTNHARHGRVAQCVGLLVQAASQTAHAVVAARGEWVTNEKSLLDRAGLRITDRIVAGAHPNQLERAVDELHAACEATVRSAVGDY